MYCSNPLLFSNLRLSVVGVFFLLSPIILIPGLGACTPTSPTMASESKLARIIIKFSDPRANPADENFMETLSRDAGTRLIYLHPAGGAHVFEAHTSDLQAVLRRLVKQPGVAYAEEDHVKHKQ